MVNSDCGVIDINGDSPSAIAAWIAWYDSLLAMPKSDEAAEELHAALAAQKREQKTLSVEHEKRVDGLFP